MKIRKDVILKRLQAQLEKLDAAEAEYNNGFSAFKAKLLAVEKERMERIEVASTYEEVCNLPAMPWLPERPSRRDGDRRRRIERNLRILDAIDDDVLEVEKLHTGKNFSLGDFFDDLL